MFLRFFLFIFVTGWAHGQVPQDSLTFYELGEIVVSPEGSLQRTSSASTVHRVALAGIAQTDAASIDHALRLIPSAHIQTNSRGERLIYLRGAGERQVALFFDGALLNVPWDNRVDLSLIPSEVVGEITVAKGVPSVLYGPNVLGGAINMTSRELRNQGSYFQLSGIRGSYSASQARLTWLRRRSRFSSTFFAGWSDRNGSGIPGGADLPYNQDPGQLRTNTDRTMRSFFAQGAYRSPSGVSVGLALLQFGGRKGVAPEGHLDPKNARVRYWRYPVWRTSMAILSGQIPFKAGHVRGAMWISRFGQHIDQYQDHNYRSLVESQEDEDDTFGARVTFLQQVSPTGTLQGAVSVLASEHWQHNDNRSATAAPLTYLQRVYSGGLEYLRDGIVQLTAGASWDLLTTPATGDKPPRPAQGAIGVTTGAVYALQSGLTLRASAGRKVRFPTMRELFGEALGRFLVNPALRPESSFLSEVALNVDLESASGEVIAFFNRTYDTIGQHMVVLPGESQPLRQRVNLEGSRIAGVELTVASRPGRGLRASCNMTLMHVRALERGRTGPLAEKPGMLGNCNLGYHTTAGLAITAESNFTGRAYGLAYDNRFVTLPGSIIVNTRVSWLILLNSYALEAFARINNVTDETTLPQLGLPGPGREVHAGLQISL